MDMKEKLVELLFKCSPQNIKTELCGEKIEVAISQGKIADYLIAHGVTVQEWISVKDRLPEYGERVIACGANGGVFMAKATTTPAFGKVDGASKYRTFNYWMPLPQPPKGE